MWLDWSSIVCGCRLCPNSPGQSLLLLLHGMSFGMMRSVTANIHSRSPECTKNMVSAVRSIDRILHLCVGFGIQWRVANWLFLCSSHVGPIVRISPWELHVDDPSFYEVLYSRESPRNKYKFYANMFGNERATIAVLDHAHHRLLRSNMNPYFSMARVRQLEPEIQTLANKLCDRLKSFKGTGVPINTQHAYSCFATDIISDYTMGIGFNFLDSPDFSPQWSATLSGIAKSSAFFKPFPWLLTIMKSLPDSFVAWLNPGMGLMLKFQARCMELILSVIESQNNAGDEKSKVKFAHPTFFHDVLNSNLPPEEKSAERLAQEIQVVIGAGGETVAKALSWITYYLLENPKTLEKLKAELNEKDPDQTASLADLEKLPYLVSCTTLLHPTVYWLCQTSVMLEGLRYVKETLNVMYLYSTLLSVRLSYGVSTRLARISTDHALQFREWTIPAGVSLLLTFSRD